MATVYIDNRPYTMDPGQNLLQACLSAGFDIPYFCWHPALGAVGACRQCAVKQYKDEHDRRGRVVMSCMTPVAEGTRISIDDAEARDFRARVIEWLMVNHPHDCPVCEEGGECHLQDMTVMTGHTYRRFRFDKRTFRNQELGPFIAHEMNRCIACYRCVRFYRDYAGGRDLHALAAHNHVYFGRHADGVLENEFSGNLVEVCPTGVFTDKTFSAHYTRKWDLRGAPSVCPHCSLGCNTHPGERYGTLRRVVNRYNGAVNGYFLCDRGRFGYGHVNSAGRIRTPLAGPGAPLARDKALERLAAMLRRPERVIGIGSPRASLEANFALRTLVGAERFCHGMADHEARLVWLMRDLLSGGRLRAPSLAEAERADAVLVLGEDVLNTAPRLALALRQAVRHAHWAVAERLRIAPWLDTVVRDAAQDARSPLFLATPVATGLDDVATATFHGAPDDLARLGGAVAAALDPAAPAVAGLDPNVQALAGEIATALAQARRPLIVTGSGAGSAAVIQAAANVARALGATRADGAPPELCCVFPECNSLGLSLMEGAELAEVSRRAGQGQVDTLLVLENDLHRRLAPAARERLLDQVPHLVVIDHLLHPTAARAELLLPAAAWVEADGTLVNNEGRAQRFFQVYPPGGEVQESWRWLVAAMRAAGRGAGQRWQRLDEVTHACAQTFPALAGITDAAPGADFRMAGQRIPRQPSRYSGRTAMGAHIDVHEPKPPEDQDAPLSFTMEGAPTMPPAPLIPYFWAPRWNSPQAVNKFQSEIAGPLRGGDPGVRLLAPGTSAHDYFQPPPEGFVVRQGLWLALPLHHIFGSEELSLEAAAVAERREPVYLAIGPDDAEAFRLAPGDSVTIALDGRRLTLPVVVKEQLRPGLAGMPVGYPETAGLVLPAWVELRGGGA